MVIQKDPPVIITRHKYGVTELRLNRPEARNAFSTTLYHETSKHLRSLSTDPKTRIILLSASGKTFSSGMDIKQASSGNPLTIVKAAEAFMRAVMDTPKPLAAAVTGAVTGIGVTLLLHCDIVFSDSRATFHTPFPATGLVPEFGSSVLFPSVLGPNRARDLLLFGRTLSADQLSDVFRLVHGGRGAVIAQARAYCKEWSAGLDDDQWRCVEASTRLVRPCVRERVDEELHVIRGLINDGVTARLLQGRAQRLARL